MRVEIMNETKVKKIHWHKADRVKQGVCARDEMMHVEMSDM